jgi:hypothetical protein
MIGEKVKDEHTIPERQSREESTALSSVLPVQSLKLLVLAERLEGGGSRLECKLYVIFK